MKKSTLILIVISSISLTSKGNYWTQKASCPMMRKTCFSFAVGLKGYTGCGRDSMSNLTNSFWQYDQQTNAWTQKADFGGVPREGVIGFTIGNKGYAGLGFNQDMNLVLQDFYEYDTATNVWTQKSYYQGLGSAYSASFAIGNYGYVCTGTNMTEDYRELWKYDPSVDSWSQLTGIAGIERQQAVGISIGNYGYIIGGYSLTDSLLLNDLWQYNSLTDTWLQKANTPGHPRCDAATFTILDKIYFGIGDTAGGDLSDFWRYDTTSNQWSQMANFPGVRRDEATYFAIGNKGYIGLGGEDANFNDFWEYSPDSSAGINEIYNEFKTSLYPTPFKEKTTLIIAGNPVNAILNIYNIQGQKVRSIIVGTNKETVIYRENLSAGIYIYEIKDGDSKTLTTGKMIVE